MQCLSLQNGALACSVREPMSLSMTLDEPYFSLTSLGPDWSDHTNTETPITQIWLCNIVSQASVLTQPLVVSHTLLVDSDLSWSVFMQGCRVQEKATNPLSRVPDHLDPTFLAIILILNSTNVCTDNPCSNYVEMAQSCRQKFFRWKWGNQSNSWNHLSCDTEWRSADSKYQDSWLWLACSWIQV